MAAILNFDNFFQSFFQKAQLDPGRVIVRKFEGRRSNDLGATDDTINKTHKQTNINSHIAKTRECISFS